MSLQTEITPEVRNALKNFPNFYNQYKKDIDKMSDEELVLKLKSHGLKELKITTKEEFIIFVEDYLFKIKKADIFKKIFQIYSELEMPHLYQSIEEKKQSRQESLRVARKIAYLLGEEDVSLTIIEQEFIQDLNEYFHEQLTTLLTVINNLQKNTFFILTSNYLNSDIKNITVKQCNEIIEKFNQTDEAKRLQKSVIDKTIKQTKKQK